MFRAGMWVVFVSENAGAQVGICYVNARTEEREVHLVDPATGETTKELPWTEDWTQATHAQIPACRRPTAEIALKYGYVVSDEDAAKVRAERAERERRERIAALEAELAEAKGAG
jgi:hypothetical protein